VLFRSRDVAPRRNPEKIIFPCGSVRVKGKLPRYVFRSGGGKRRVYRLAPCGDIAGKLFERIVPRIKAFYLRQAAAIFGAKHKEW
jgi:hypothetical protein